jgi:predicted nuclease of predicted toxin-antitoxin system
LTPVPGFVADESCDFALVRALRAAGFSVRSIAEESPRATDADVLRSAAASGRVLLTEDRDFGRLVFGNSAPSAGVVLIRYPSTERLEMAERTVEFVRLHGSQLSGVFVTLTPRRARFRRLPES